MANIKISELNELTNIATDDLLPIVDTSVNETKKVQLKNVLNVELIAISDTAPAECLVGDKYYNTEDNKIYTAIATDTWGTIGETPVKGVFYIVFNEQSSYSYDGSTLISVGGGTEDIVISDTEPTEEDWKIWIDSSEQADNTYYNDNGTATQFKATTYDTLPVGTEVDYDGETVPSGWSEIDEYDTGWVDLSSYVNTSNFAIRSGFTPMARKIGNMVFWKGAIYCTTALNNTSRANLLTNVPEKFLPTGEVSCGGTHYGLGIAYKMYIGSDGNLTVAQGNSIPATSDYQGYSLSDLGPYLID